MINENIATGMREATRLTRAGQLHEAVAIIQHTLQGGLGPKPAAGASRTADQKILEGRYRISDDKMGTYARKQRQHSSPGPETGRQRTPTPPAFGAGLQETLQEQLRKQLRTYRGPMPGSKPTPDRTPDIVPHGGRFTSGSYTNNAGTRSYKLYIPSSYHGQPLPLVVMLHGCTQNPDDFAAGTRMNVLAEKYQCLVAYPAQSATANVSKCWNWFEAADQQRDHGEPSIIAGITRQIGESYRVDEKRIYVAGLSAGGAMALTMAMTYPDLYAAVGIHSGLAYAVAQDLPSALGAMHSGQAFSAHIHTAGATGTKQCAAPIPAIVFHGDRDMTVHPGNGEQVVAQCVGSHAERGASPEDGLAARVKVEQGRATNGHAYTRTTYHNANKQPIAEQWIVHGAGHAWSGGGSHGSFTDPKGPDASQEMLRFFYDHPQAGTR